MPHCRVIAPRKFAARPGADDPLPIVPQPVGAAASRNADPAESRRLAKVNAGPVQVCHEQRRRGRVAKLPRLPLDNPGDQPTANADALHEPLDAPIDPRLALEFEIDAVSACRFIRRRRENEIDAFIGKRFEPRQVVRLLA